MSELRLSQLRKQYGNNIIVEGVNLTVASGEMVSLLGPSGCGKTTTLRMIAGLLEPTSGSIHLGDRDITRVAPHQRNVGLVFQNYALFPHLTIYENVAFGLKRHGTPKGEIHPRVMEALETVRLGGYESRLPAQLSGGQQQRVALARTLVLRPPLVLFDEPLSNLDAKLRQLLRVEIRQLQKKFGFTAIFVTHDQEEAMVLSDRIAVMHKGHIVQLDTPQKVYNRPQDEFVADFVGDSNLLPIAEEKKVGDDWQVTIAGGQTIKANNIGQTSNHSTVMVRPEAIQIYSGEEVQERGTAFNTVNGKVLFAHYAGATYFVGLQVQGQEKPFMIRCASRSDGSIPLQEGANAQAVWPVEATLLF